MMERLIRRLRAIRGVRVMEYVNASRLSRWRTGGEIRCWIEPQDEAALEEVVNFFLLEQVPYRIVGETSNLLITDELVHCPIVSFRGVGELSRLELNGTRLYAGAGVYVPKLAWYAAKNSLSGLEHAVGIPGSFGGLVYMNGGSLRRNIGEVISTVKALCLASGEMVHLEGGECNFDYRKSIFQAEGHCIVGAVMLLEREEEVGAAMRRSKEILKQRREKFPLFLPNCGSVFSSPLEMYNSIGPAGAVIESCGLKGIQRGGALISEEHANFIVNSGGAKSEDILYLISLVIREVKARTGFSMKTEVQFLSADGRVLPAHMVI